MASSRSAGRILRKEDSGSAPPVDQSRFRLVAASKPCVVRGCTGTMDFRERPDRRAAKSIQPAHWEFPWYSSWQCRQDSTHIQLIDRAEEIEMLRQNRLDRKARRRVSR
jgi:hypothetical protein